MTTLESPAIVRAPSVGEHERVLLLSASSVTGLVDALGDAMATVRASASGIIAAGDGAGPRIGIVDPTDERIELARKIVAKGKPWRGRKDIWFSPEPLLASGGRLAYVFPGLEAEFAPRVDDVAALLGVPVPDLNIQTMGRHAGAVFAVNGLFDRALHALSIRPDAVAGHSAGEWQAMISGGIVDRSDFDRMMAGAELDALRVPGVEFAVLGAPLTRIADEVAARPDLVISHENSPSQTVICGPGEQVNEVLAALRAKGVICQPLPFQSGFHTPMLAPYLAPFEERGLPSLPMRAASVPVWSATTASPFPAGPEAIRALSVRHLLEPVRFLHLVRGLYDSGVRVFVQAGFGQLGSLVDDTLRTSDHLTVSASTAHRSGVAQLRRVATAVWTEGGAPDFGFLDPGSAGLGAGGLDSAGLGPAGLGSVRLGSVSIRSTAAASTAANTVASPAAAPAQATARPAAPRPDAAARPDPFDQLRRLGASNPMVAELNALLEETAAAVTAVVDMAGRAPAFPRTSVRTTRAHVAPARPAPTHPMPAKPTTPAHSAPVTAPRPTPQPRPDAPITFDQTLEVSTTAMPYLLDHCLNPQREGWPDDSDRRPVVPATTMVTHMIDAAVAAAPGHVVTEVTDVRFRKWLIAAPAQRVEITVRPHGPDRRRVMVRLGEFADAVVTLERAHRGDGPVPWPVSENEREPELTAQQIYDDRWMFHGPRFQGITGYTAISDEGIRGQITVPPPPGALLDNAGQFLGLWMTQLQRQRCLAFPVQIDRIVFHEPEPGPGAVVETEVKVTALVEDRVTADLRVSAGGRTLISISGWQDYRVEGDWNSCTVHRFPERSMLAARQEGGWWLLADPWTTLAAREFFLSKYLGAAEREEYLRLPPPSRWRWLAARIVIKDAVRDWLWIRGRGPIYPAELQVWQDTFGFYRVTGMNGLSVPSPRIAVTSSHELTVANVRSESAPVPCVIELGEVIEASLRVHKSLTRGEEIVLDRLREATSDALPVALARFDIARRTALAALSAGACVGSGTVTGAAEIIGVDGDTLVVAVADDDGGRTVLRVGSAVLRNPERLPARQYLAAWIQAVGEAGQGGQPMTETRRGT